MKGTRIKTLMATEQKAKQKSETGGETHKTRPDLWRSAGSNATKKNADNTE